VFLLWIMAIPGCPYRFLETLFGRVTTGFEIEKLLCRAKDDKDSFQKDGVDWLCPGTGLDRKIRHRLLRAVRCVPLIPRSAKGVEHFPAQHLVHQDAGKHLCTFIFH